ncbi:MAG TPA: 3-methyl-2-oxobutanoate hydroxymethyltransferase [Verrucomicrobiae bacterium]|nr:3-methyl-2-oxobutanoate hydroxymethyltransferase [Verrucomicrobiae bacterium]
MPKVTVEEVRHAKGRRPRLLALTAYDYPIARLLDEAGVDVLHVGDSLGMLVLGHEDTTRVTMDDMERHVRAVARGRRRALITADLPIHAYDDPAAAVANSRRLIDAGADAVKLEGGHEIAPQIRALIAAGIPVQGHLGMLPQRIREEGGYRRKGKTDLEREHMIQDAQLLAEVGCFSIVLECVVHDVATAVTAATPVPTLGIASGDGCDGEIRVVHDVIGLFPWFVPPFAKPLEHVADRISDAVIAFRESIG